MKRNFVITLCYNKSFLKDELFLKQTSSKLKSLPTAPPSSSPEKFRPLRRSKDAFEKAELQVRAFNCARAIQMAIFLVPLGLILDYWIYPQHFTLFLWVRLAATIAVGLFLIPLRNPTPAKLLLCSHLVAAILSMMLIWMIYHGNDPLSPYQQGLSLVMVAAAIVIRWRFIDSLLYSTVVIAIYTLVFLNLGGPTGDLIIKLYFLFVTAIFTSSGCLFYYNLRQREFYLREELEANRLTLQTNNAELQALDEAKNRFFANVSHELRTPLTLILGPIEQLTSLPALKDLPQARSHIETLSENGFRLLRLINDLLELARLETGDLPVRLENVDLPEFSEGIRRSLAAMAETKKITFTVNAYLPEHSVQALDRDRLEKILLNLAINALKFTPDGGKVTLKLREDDRNLNIIVADNGIGLSEDELPHIFERFWQADSSTKRKSRGAGIGLALAKNLAESMEGQLYVISAPDEGTTFTLALPISPPQPGLENSGPLAPLGDSFDFLQDGTLSHGIREHTPDPQTSPFSPSFQSTSAKKFRILVVDDEASMRSYLSSFLTGHLVHEAADGREGLELAREHLPHLIILDYMMPELDGIEVCRILRSQPATERIPIILVTAHGGDAPRLAALEAGVNDFLTKPFYSSELLARVQNLLLSQEYQTDLKSSNQNLSQALVQLREKEEELVRSEKLSSLGEMSAGIVHEINNPLNYANTALHILKTFRTHLPKTEVEDYEETLGDLSEALTRVINIITDLRALTRGGEVVKSPIRLHKVIENARRFLAPELGEISLELQISEDHLVQGNDNQLCQVFVNLIKNAVHATSDQTDPQISIKSSLIKENTICILLSDNGHGIPDEIRRKIFDPFFTTKDVGIGMGLGLSLTMKIIQDHQGIIQLTSTPDQGTTFEIQLPCSPSADI